jgi:hypothetical protein
MVQSTAKKEIGPLDEYFPFGMQNGHGLVTGRIFMFTLNAIVWQSNALSDLVSCLGGVFRKTRPTDGQARPTHR